MARFHTLALVLPLGFLLACGGPLEYQVASSPKAPGADAHIVADVGTEQNTTLLKIEVKNLTPPGRIREGASSFVVWQRRDAKAIWARVGALNFDEEDRTGTFEGSVPESAFDLSITAESALDVASPSADVVFAQRVQKE